MNSDQLLQIGKIVGVFGVRGELKVFKMAEDAAFFDPGRRVMLRMQDERRAQHTVRTVKPYKNILRVHFKEIPDRNAAEKLVGANVFIPRSALPETDPDTWYWCDLIGLDVYTVDNQSLGRVTSMIETGSNDVFVVTGESGEILIPAIASVVIEVDLKKNRILVDPPEGL
jgi:16S rRNA processing protein RimM